MFSSPAIGSDGTIYVGSHDYNLYAINPDGSRKLRFKTGNWVSSSPSIGSDGTIYVGSCDNNLYAIKEYEINISDQRISKGQSLTLQYFPQPTFTYQWFYNAKEIPGATSISYTIENADLEDSGTYVLAIMYQTGKVRLYKPAVITVVPPHNITDQEIKAGESLTLAIEQAPNRTYQWFKNNKLIEGANLPNLKLENTQAKDTGLYSLKVISQSGETSKFEANINVLSPPVITAEPISLAFIEGGSFKLDTTVIGTEPLSFQWYRDGKAIDGANSNYFRSVKGGSIPGNYKLIIKNEYGSVESREVKITEGVGIEIEIGKEGQRKITLKAKSNEGNWMIESSSNLINWTVLAPLKKGKVFVGIEKKWKFKTGDDVTSSPAIGSDGTIYVGSYDNNLYAINPDGSKKWAFRTGDDVYSSPVIGSDGTIYVGSDDHNLYAINPDGSKKWNFKTRFEVSSSPAIGSDGTIYVGSEDNYLYAIEETYKDIKIITDTRDDAEILLEQHTAKHGGFGIRTWSAEKGNLKSFDETKGMYEILSPAEFADRFDLAYPIKLFYRARLSE